LDLIAVRRRFGRIHDELRNAGKNPIEAVELIANLFVATGDERERLLQELSPRASHEAALVIQEASAAAGNGAIAFQELLVSESRNGLGQYLTPLPVAQLIAQVVTPHVDDNTLVLDPFCGSGLLLEEIGRGNNARLLGIEINGSVATIAEAFAKLSNRTYRVHRADAFWVWSAGEVPQADICVTNPPFGALATVAKHADLREAGAAPELIRMDAIPSELLGLDLAVASLKEGGIVAIVLPQSVLTNRSWRSYRTRIFSKLRLDAVVSLPEETFAPFKGVAKSCLLVGHREAVTLPHSVPYFRSASVGYDNTGRPSSSPSDLPDIGTAILSGATLSLARLDPDGTIAFPSTLTIESRRATVALGDVAHVFRGKNPPRDDFFEEADAPWLLKVGDLEGSFVSWRERPRCHVRPQFFERNIALHLAAGDICLTGSAHRPSYIGLKVDLLDELPDVGAMPSGEVLTIRLRPGVSVDPVELLFYLRSAEGYGQIQELVRGSTGHLYPRDLSTLRLPVESGFDRGEVTKLYWEAAAAFRSYLALESAAKARALPRHEDEVASAG